MKQDIAFARLTAVDPAEILAHMSDPRVAEHMPLLTFTWTAARVADFVAAKEAYWRRDGLGHWAFLADGRYIGWGGFQKEEGEWDLGLVLSPGAFGHGPGLARRLVAFAKADPRIPFVTFLLPPSRRNLGALRRLGARPLGDITYDGATFRKYRLDTS